MRRLFLLYFLFCSLPAAAIGVGAADTAAYFSHLAGRRIAVLANHTSLVDLPGVAGADAAGRIHLVDLLHGRGFDVAAIFAPEHGFRGTADAGATVEGSTDARTGIPIRSLYDGRTRRPAPEAMRGIDVLVVDMQDVGTRFYTYYIAMIRMMEAAAQADAEVIVLDRPNPNGSYVDGPLLEERYRSGVGELPIPVVHGLTLGELARMAIGEGWVPPCRLTVVPCRDYTHRDRYVLPVPPSPNLRSQRAVYLYPSLCLTEGTVLSVGRGTERPFELYGHPDLKQALFRFTPRSVAGAAHPPFEGVCCRGYDLGEMDEERILAEGLNPEYLIDAYRALGLGEKFFTPLFEKLVGAGWVRRMIVEGRSAAELRAAWAPDVARFRELRRKYLLYPE